MTPPVEIDRRGFLLPGLQGPAAARSGPHEHVTVGLGVVAVVREVVDHRPSTLDLQRRRRGDGVEGPQEPGVPGQRLGAHGVRGVVVSGGQRVA
ncbi:MULTISPECIES: hypothetical protein [unclassified Corynebacterium]|uniref:hypothetical protein n=1 Tax=unclassified Corynebacterium TaxID=2624378 RepID=UPI00265598D5|nr:hypothetical protein [Corynebacterium sp.]